MTLAVVLFAALAFLGHAAFWIGINNRWHGTAFSRVVLKGVAVFFYACLIAPLLLATWTLARHDWSSGPSGPLPPAVLAYVVFCAVYGALFLGVWLVDRWRSTRMPEMVTALGQHIVDVAAKMGSAPACGPRAKVLSLVPLNQVFEIHVAQYEVQLAGLDPGLDGLSICHWSDLHISGRIDKPYFREVAAITTDLDVDIVALTGDVCERARYFEWIAETLAPTKTRLGKYFILGNHDLRTRDVAGLRRMLESAGFADVGGRTATVANGRLIVAGNERPWFPCGTTAETIAESGASLRILLAHAPDQLSWARSHGFHLMLAGHTHGGQIRFPLIGAVLCPSRHGTRYAGGFFHRPPTLMHVSRGTGSLFPLRLNCAPEITKIVLRRPA